MPRKPSVAGMFYESDFNRLNEQIKNCFLSSFGPGSMPKEKKDEEIKAAIIPHAGYVYSGGGAAHAYKAIAEARWPDVFIIIAPNHTGMGYNSILLENMESPFGEVKVDFEFARALINNTPLVDDASAHIREHAVEVHIPFLQFIAKDNLKKLRIVPIVLNDCDFIKIGKEIRKIAEEQNKKICVIASSDFIHYGINYGYFPFTKDVKKNLTEMGKKAYEFIKNKEAEKFIKYTQKTGATICGKYPIAVLLETLEDENAELLSYYSSGDITKDYSSCVDYMSIIFRAHTSSAAEYKAYKTQKSQ